MRYQNIIKYSIVLLVGVALFILDINTEQGVASGINYVVLVLLSLWLKEVSAPIILGFISSILIILGWLISPNGSEEWKVLLNRTFSIIGVLVVAIVLFYLKKRKNIQANLTDTLNSQFRRNIILIFCLFFGGVLFFSILYRNDALAIEQQHFKTKQEKLLAIKTQMEASLRSLFSDVLFLSQLDNSERFFSTEKGRQELKRDFTALMHANKFYYQIRFIDKDGDEKVRVNNNDGNIFITPDSALQNKSNRPYFKESINLTERQIYVSEMELNVENGVIEKPYKPVIRVASVVEDDHKNKIGIIVINFLANSILEFIETELEKDKVSFQLINENGFWLSGKDSSNFEGFIDKGRAEKKHNSFALKNPDTWNYIQQNERGIIKDNDLSFAFENFDINDVFYRYYKGVAKIHTANSHQLVLVYSIENTDLSVIKHKNIKYYISGLFIYLLSFILILRYIIKKQTHLKTTYSELASTNQLFKETQKIAKIGSWKVNIAQMKVYWSDEVYRIHEEEMGKEIDLTKGIEYYHPDYRDLIQSSVDEAIKNNKSWDVEAKLITAKGNEIWVRAIGKPYYVNNELTELRGLFMDITELKSLNIELEQLVKEKTKDLQETNERLIAANDELEAFSYSVSHDLKAPLRALQGFSENLYKKYNDQFDETGLRWLQFIKDNAVRMDHLIRDVLIFSRIGRSDIELKEVSTQLIVEKCIQSERDNYENPVQLNIKKLDNVKVDPTMFEMLWQNLIGNAFKYSSTKEKIEITIDSRIVGDMIEFRITDNGVGFDMKYYDKLFNVFQRLHSNEEFSGTGVGLANVKRIIDKHRGEIKATSKLGEGTTFIFKIPK